MKKEKLHFGALEDLNDERDFRLSTLTMLEDLPGSVDISNDIFIVKNQGEEGTCVANAGTELKEFFDKEQLSVRYLYYRGREISGLPPSPKKGEGEGMFPRDMMKCLFNKGVCEERSLPYRVFDWSVPTQEHDKEALEHTITHYVRIYNITELKQHLATNKIPAVLTVPIYDNAVNWYRSNVKANNNTIAIGGNTRTSGHAILVVGYDDSRKAFKILNSWGESWGEGGYAWLPYEYPWSDCWTGADEFDIERYEGMVLEDSDGIAYLIEDGEKHWSPDLLTFYSYGFTTDEIIKGADKILAAIPEGGQMQYLGSLNEMLFNDMRRNNIIKW